MTSVQDLKAGDRIPTDLCGHLTVIAAYADIDDNPDLSRVYVDVEVQDRSLRWDVENLPAAVGAESFWFLSMTPTLRYRLVFLPDATVGLAC